MGAFVILDVVSGYFRRHSRRSNCLFGYLKPDVLVQLCWATGVTIQIAALKKLTFTAAKALKDKLNG